MGRQGKTKITRGESMTIDDLEKFEEIIQVLNETFGNSDRPISDLKMRFYFQTLSDLTIDQLNNGAVNLANIKTVHTFPTPAEIREAAIGKAEDRAVLAFEDLIMAIQAGGYYRSIVFEDGAIVRCIEAMGGWDQVCDWKVEDREWHRKDFMRLYRTFTDKGALPPAKVIGAHEHHNRLNGFEKATPEPLKIGAQKPQLVAVKA